MIVITKLKNYLIFYLKIIEMNPFQIYLNHMLKISKDLRKKVISIIQKNKRGHIGPAFSLIEILWSIYNTDFYFNSHSKFFHLRDRVILSKGHGCLALYSVLNEKGILPDDALASFCEFESILGGHPERRIEYGIEASTGSLGHGLSLGVGIAKSHQIKKNVDSKVFVIFIVLFFQIFL